MWICCSTSLWWGSRDPEWTLQLGRLPWINSADIWLDGNGEWRAWKRRHISSHQHYSEIGQYDGRHQKSCTDIRESVSNSFKNTTTNTVSLTGLSGWELSIQMVTSWGTDVCCANFLLNTSMSKETYTKTEHLPAELVHVCSFNNPAHLPRTYKDSRT